MQSQASWMYAVTGLVLGVALGYTYASSIAKPASTALKAVKKEEDAAEEPKPMDESESDTELNDDALATVKAGTFEECKLVRLHILRICFLTFFFLSSVDIMRKNGSGHDQGQNSSSMRASYFFPASG